MIWLPSSIPSNVLAPLIAFLSARFIATSNKFTELNNTTTSDSLTDPINYFYITSTSNATSGGVSGGGANTSAGPVTLGVVNG
mgnify:CR=1 FL=1